VTRYATAVAITSGALMAYAAVVVVVELRYRRRRTEAVRRAFASNREPIDAEIGRIFQNLRAERARRPFDS
jgi:predicted nucleic acid-binding protein